MCKYTISGLITDFLKQDDAGKRSVGEPLLQRFIP